mmetsp:Transcript_37358/g.86231  ORF Transcript_37358/g.86231 Transcript_37358/m.86231 type:complete len:280 (-) Transcript_37358:16-855(-)
MSSLRNSPRHKPCSNGLLLLLGHLGGVGLLLLVVVLRQALRIGSLGLFPSLHALSRLGLEVALPLQKGRSDEALDLWGLRLLIFFDFTANHKLPHVILLLQTEELSDVGGSLGAKTTRLVVIGEACDVFGTLLDHDKVQHSKVRANNAASHRLALAATGAALAVAGHALFEEQTHAVIAKHTLLHWEALLVIPTTNAKHIAFELVAECVSRDFAGHALVKKGIQLLVIIDLNELLHSRGRVGDVELHGDSTGDQKGKQILAIRPAAEIALRDLSQNGYG